MNDKDLLKFNLDLCQQVAQLTEIVFTLTTILEQKNLISNEEHNFLIKKLTKED